MRAILPTLLFALALSACDPAPAPTPDAGQDAGPRCTPLTSLQCFGAWPECCDEGPTEEPVCGADGRWQCPGLSVDHCDCAWPDAGL